MTNTDKSKSTNTTTCHLLPCNIHYDGMSPVHLYFHPTLVAENDQAAQFRGRGLVSFPAIPLPNDIQGLVTTVSSSSRQMQVLSSFQSISEWHHVHETTTTLKSNQNDGSTTRGALEWFQVARSVHDSIPINNSEE